MNAVSGATHIIKLLGDFKRTITAKFMCSDTFYKGIKGRGFVPLKVKLVTLAPPLKLFIPVI